MAKSAAISSGVETLLAKLAETQHVTAKALSKLAKKGGSDSDSSDADTAEGGAVAGKKFNLPHKLRGKLSQNPEKVLNEWEDRVRFVLGAEPGMPWLYTDYTSRMRTSFGSPTGLYRTHQYIIS